MDKNKILESVAKLVAKGAYDKAIKELQKILDSDPKDVRVLQKMGELYQKKNDNPGAAQYFIKVAESYSNDGFFLKAVALYKQVLKLDPSLVTVNLKLAELHQQLQLVGEAMAYYQVVANHYDKSGDTRSSLDTLKKMVDLDPDNIPSRVKLAELYARENMPKDAVVEFRRAADYLKRNSRVDDYMRVSERISVLEPDNLPLAKELAEHYLRGGDPKRALAKLQVCFKADAQDVPTLRMLAQAFGALGQTAKTISVHKELARVFETRGQSTEAENEWKQVAKLDPNDADAQGRNLGGFTPQAPAPSAPPGERSAAEARTAAPPPSSARPGGLAKEQVARVLTETDVYVKYGLHDKALEHLRKIFAVDAENIDAHEKAYQIYAAASNAPQAAEQLLNVLRLHTRRGDSERAAPFLKAILESNPTHPEVPVFVAALKQDGGPDAQPEVDDEEAILVVTSEEEIVVAEEPEDALPETAVEEEEEAIVEEDEEQVISLADEDAAAAAQIDIEAPPVADSEQVDPVMSLDDLPDEPLVAGDGDESLVEEEGAALGDDVPEVSTGVVQVMGDDAGFDAEASFQEPEALVEEEPVSETVYEEEPVEAPPQEEAAYEAPPQEEAVEAPPEDEPAGEECDEAQFFLDQGLYEEAREILETILVAYPSHQRAATMLEQLAQAESGNAPVPSQTADTTDVAPPPAVTVDAGEGRDAFDLAAELADELGSFGGEAPSAPAPGDDDFQYSVEEVFSEFKKGLAKVVKPEDVDTHYDLGIAYKEMGLIDDAIGEFEVARQGCVGKKKEIDCLTMTGLLQSMKGDMQGAVVSYQTALTNEFAGGDTEKALRYELAAAYESAGEPGKALGQYLRVQGLDGGYREVAQHVERLSSEVAPEDDVAA